MGNGAMAVGPKLPRPSSTLPSLPIGHVRSDGEFRVDSGLVVFTWSFVEIDPKRVTRLVNALAPRTRSHYIKARYEWRWSSPHVNRFLVLPASRVQAPS